MTDNPLIRGGDAIDVMVDEAKRELRTQFMKHWRVIRTWELPPVPVDWTPTPMPTYDPDPIYADMLTRPWLRT